MLSWLFTSDDSKAQSQEEEPEESEELSLGVGDDELDEVLASVLQDVEEKQAKFASEEGCGEGDETQPDQVASTLGRTAIGEASVDMSSPASVPAAKSERTDGLATPTAVSDGMIVEDFPEIPPAQFDAADAHHHGIVPPKSPSRSCDKEGRVPTIMTSPKAAAKPSPAFASEAPTPPADSAGDAAGSSSTTITTTIITPEMIELERKMMALQGRMVEMEKPLVAESGSVDFSMLLSTPALAEIYEVMTDMDENSDGFVDLQEFVEAMHEIDILIPKRVLESIYRDCTFTKAHELHIQTFVRELHEKTRPSPTMPARRILRSAFPVLFNIAPGASSSSSLLHPHLVKGRGAKTVRHMADSDEPNAEQLAMIKSVFKSLDEDRNGRLDYPEFAEGLQSMGVDTETEVLQLIFAHWVIGDRKLREMEKKKKKKAKRAKKKRKKHKKKKSRRKRKKKSSSKKKSGSGDDSDGTDGSGDEDDDDEFATDVSDSDSDDSESESSEDEEILPGKQLGSATASRTVGEAELRVRFIVDQCKRAVNGTKESLPVHFILVSSFQPVLAIIKMPPKKKKKPRSRTDSGIHETDADKSILHRPGKVLAAIAALRQGLQKVDKNGDGKVKLKEFRKCLSSLFSKLDKRQSLELFERFVNPMYADDESEEDIIPIGLFCDYVGSSFRQNIAATCDQVLLRMSQESDEPVQSMTSFGTPTAMIGKSMSFSHGARSSFGSGVLPFNPAFSRAGSLTSVTPVTPVGGITSASAATPKTPNPAEVTANIQAALVKVDSDSDGHLTYDEFKEFLTAFDLYHKIDSDEVRKVFDHLCVDSSSMQVDAYMQSVRNVLADHPKYAERRCVFRAFRRISKILSGAS